MLKQDVLKFFGGPKATSDALGVTTSAIHQWGEIIPRGAAYIAQAVSNGALRVDPASYPPKKFGPRKAKAMQVGAA